MSATLLITKSFLGVLVALGALILLRSSTLTSLQLQGLKPFDSTEFGMLPSAAVLARRLSGAIQIPTVSFAPGVQNTTAITELHEFLVQTFPRVHATLKLEKINKLSLLYHWEGSNPNLKPIMLCSHLDVVPADPESWDIPPFDGAIRDGFIWGRGTLDDKQGVMAILESVEHLLGSSSDSGAPLAPVRTILLAFGHDEEVRGSNGALHINRLLMERGVQLEYLLDEGMPIARGMIPGMPQPVALIGTAEKGWANVELVVNTSGGHSSMPPPQSAVGILAAAITKLEATRMPIMFGRGPERAMFEHIAAEMQYPLKAVFANLWLFSPLVGRLLAAKPNTNAVVRTTTAVTMFSGGVKSNVLPRLATATVNHRIHPGNTVAEVLQHHRNVINDPRVEVRLKDGLEPSPVSPCDSDAYDAVQRSLKQVFPEVAVAPGLFIANSDTRHYWDLTPNIFRFCPSILTQSDVSRIHGVNERIGVRNYERIVHFYTQLIMNSQDLE